MAVNYESVSTGTWFDTGSGGNLVITKPTGLAVGDRMVAHLTAVVGGSPNAQGWDTPSGWTLLVSGTESTESNSSVSMYVFHKIADSSDVAASNFTFVKTGSDNSYSNGALYRISGDVGIAGTIATTNSDTTPAFANTITPTAKNSLLLFLVSSSDANSGANTVGTYAITTSNPSWTERYELDITEAIGFDRGVMSGATAVRPEMTATGNSSCLLSKTQNTIGAIIVLTSSPIVQAVSTAAWEGNDAGQTITITKPSGTEDGDLLIAHLAGSDQTAGANTITEPGGWTSLGNVSAGATGSADLWVWYKVASSEGASYNFSNGSGAGLMMAGAIYRISNWAGTPTIATDGDDTSDSTPNFTNTITPTDRNSLILLLIGANANSASGSVTGYAITTDNLSTWTEHYDQYGTGDVYFGSGDGDGLMAGASGTRYAITATGDSTCTLTGVTARSVGAIVVVQPQTAVTVVLEVITVTSEVQSPSVSGAANFSPSVIDITTSVVAPTVSSPIPDWTNVDKSSVGTWNNQDKS